MTSHTYHNISVLDIPELHHRFIKLPMAVPRAPLVFTLPDSIENVQEKVLLGNYYFFHGELLM